MHEPTAVAGTGGAPSVSIVVPCRDEEGTIARLLAALDRSVAELAALGRPAEVIVVDDGSRDRSWELLAAALPGRPWLRLVRLRRGFGQTAAMVAGFERARGEVVVPMDADLQNDPADIPRLLARLDDSCDVVSGWRRRRHDHALTRRLPSRAANWLIGRVTGLRLHDYGCTLKAYRRDIVRELRLYGEMHRFIPLYARAVGARVVEVEVTHHPRREGRSKHRLNRLPRVLLDLAAVKLLTEYATRPLHFFGGIGILLALAGFLGGGATIAAAAVLGPSAWDLPLGIVAAMLVLGGLQLVAVGLLAELSVRTYHEARGRPIYLVAEERAGLAGEQAAEQPAAAAGA